MKRLAVIGDTVITPDPIEDDLYSHSFIGYVVDIDNMYAVVLDTEGDAYEIEPFRLIVVNEEDENN